MLWFSRLSLVHSKCQTIGKRGAKFNAWQRSSRSFATTPHTLLMPQVPKGGFCVRGVNFRSFSKKHCFKLKKFCFNIFLYKKVSALFLEENVLKTVSPRHRLPRVLDIHTVLRKILITSLKKFSSAQWECLEPLATYASDLLLLHDFFS